MLIFGNIKQVIELQRDLSFAEQIAMAIIGITVHRDRFKNIPVLLNGSGKESIFENAYIEVKEKMEEYDKLKEENEKLKELLKKYDK